MIWKLLSSACLRERSTHVSGKQRQTKNGLIKMESVRWLEIQRAQGRKHFAQGGLSSSFDPEDPQRERGITHLTFLHKHCSRSFFSGSFVMSYYSVRKTDTPAIKNAPLEGLAEGNGSFSNVHLAILVVVVPWLAKRILPVVNRGGFKTYVFMLLLLGVPTTLAYWTVMSMVGRRKNEKILLPGRAIEEYMTINDDELKAKYHGTNKIPMQVFHDAYFEGKIDFNGTFLFPFLCQ